MRITLLLLIAAGIHQTPAGAQVTYSREISRLIEAKCETCHREGDIAPFTLASYSEVRSRLSAIRSQVSNGQMPPWKPAGGEHRYSNFFGLTEAERQILLGWIAAGAPEGNPADLPVKAPAAGGWQLGEPDAVVSMPQAFTVPEGGDTYRCFVLPYEIGAASWIKAVQVAPGNRALVHHALLFADPEGVSEAWDGADGRPGYDCFGSAGEGVDEVLAAWAPGYRASSLPDGLGIPLPRRGRLVLQVHYHPHDGHHAQELHKSHAAAPSSDQTSLALYFTRSRPRQEMIYLPLDTEDFEIPAGAGDHTVEAEFEMPAFLSVDLHVLGPHMHLLGRSIKVEKFPTDPAAKAETLIAIPDWDFNWQGLYTLRQPVPLEPFSRVRVTCSYDNSAANPRNPHNPPQAVTYGESTTDEMCLSFLGVALPEGLSLQRARPLLESRKPRR